MTLIKKGIYFLLAATLVVGCLDEEDQPVPQVTVVVTNDGTAYGGAGGTSDGTTGDTTGGDTTGGDTTGGDTTGGDTTGGDDPLAGTSWSIAPEDGALGVGPASGDTGWWYLNQHGDDVTARACLMDDVFTFHADGSFEVDLGTETWIEAWQDQDVNGDGVSGEAPSDANGWSADEGCFAPVAPHVSSAEHSWTADSSSITLTGLGAFLGLSKVYNGSEHTVAGPTSPEEITYTILDSSDIAGGVLVLELEVVTADGSAGFWTFKLSKN
jgi:hypothetical protein